MAEISWLNPYSGNWATDDDWTGLVAPGPNDVAILGYSASYTVTISSPLTVGAVENDDYYATLSIVGSSGPVAVTGDFASEGYLSVDAIDASGGDVLDIGGVLTNTSVLTIGNSHLSAPAKVSVGGLSNLGGQISIQGSADSAATLEVNSAAGFGNVGELDGNVSLSGDSAIVFASDSLSTIGQSGQLTITGSEAFVEDAGAPSSQSALTGLTGNSGTLALANGASLSLEGALANTGSILLENSSGATAPTLLAINAEAGFGATGALSGNVYITDDSILQFASGGFTSIAAQGNLALDGPAASIQTLADGSINSALDSLTSNQGSLTLENGASLALAGALTNSGSINLNGGSTASAASTLTIDAAAGFGTEGVVTGNISLEDDSAITFASGSFTAIAVGSSLSINGPDAFVANVTAPASNSALTGLASNLGSLDVTDGASVTLDDALTNTGGIYLNNGADDTTQTDLVIHSLAGFGDAGVLTGYVSIYDDSAITFDSGEINKIASGSSLLLSGDAASLADAEGASVNSALTGLSDIAGDLSLSDGASLSVAGPLTNSGYISLTNQSAKGAPTQLSIGSVAGLGTQDDLTGNVSVSDDSTLTFASGSITTISSNAELTLDGATAFVADAADPGGDSALAGLSNVEGTLYLEEGAAVTTTGPLNVTGALELYNYDDSAPTTMLDIGGAAGLGATGEIDGRISLYGNADIRFASGLIATIAEGANLYISGPTAFVSDAMNPNANSALAGLQSVVGSLDLSGGASIATTGPLTVTGTIDLTGSSGAPLTVLDVGAAAGVLTGAVDVGDDALLEYASGEITSIAQSGNLTLGGSHGFVADSDDLTSNSALTGLQSVAGRLTLAGDANVDLTGALTNTGSITLSNYGVSSAQTPSVDAAAISEATDVSNTATLSINSAAGFGQTGVLTGSISLDGAALIAFTSGGIGSIAAGASLSIDGDDAFMADSDDLTSNSALTTLASNAGDFFLSDGVSLTTTVAFDNTDFFDMSSYGNAAGSSFQIGGELTNSGSFDVGSGSVTASSLDDTATGDIYVSGDSSSSEVIAIDGPAAIEGTFEIGDAKASIVGAVTGAGKFILSNDAVLELGSSASTTVSFESGSARLQLDDPTTFAGTLDDFIADDTIDLVGALATRAYIVGSTLTVDLNGGGALQYAVSNVGSDLSVNVVTDGADGSDLVLVEGAPPTIVAPAAASVVEGAASSLGAISVVDNDPLADPITVYLVSGESVGASGSGTFTAQQVGAATVAYYGGGELILSGDIADVNAELASVAYTGGLRDTSAATSSAVVTVYLDDSDNQSVQQTIDVTVATSAVTLAAPATSTVVEGVASTLGAISLADSSTQSGVFTVSVSDQSGELYVTQMGAATVLNSGSGSVTLTGDLADINSELSDLTYVGAPPHGSNDAATDTVTIVAKDPNGALDQQVVGVTVDTSPYDHFEAAETTLGDDITDFAAQSQIVKDALASEAGSVSGAIGTLAGIAPQQAYDATANALLAQPATAMGTPLSAVDASQVYDTLLMGIVADNPADGALPANFELSGALNDLLVDVQYEPGYVSEDQALLNANVQTFYQAIGGSASVPTTLQPYLNASLQAVANLASDATGAATASRILADTNALYQSLVSGAVSGTAAPAQANAEIAPRVDAATTTQATPTTETAFEDLTSDFAAGASAAQTLGDVNAIYTPMVAQGPAHQRAAARSQTTWRL